jgi:hypothetical protein
MARLVDAREAEIAVLAYFAVFGTVYNHSGVPGAFEFFAVGIVDCEADGFATEPIA